MGVKPRIGMRPMQPVSVMRAGPPDRVDRVLPAQLLRRLLLFFDRLDKHALMQRVLGTKERKEETIGKCAERTTRKFCDGKAHWQLRGQREEQKFRKRAAENAREFLDRFFTTRQLQLEPIMRETT